MTEPKKEKCEACYGSGYINFWTDDGHISMRTCRRCDGYGYIKAKPMTNEEYLKSCNTEQLADLMSRILGCSNCPIPKDGRSCMGTYSGCWHEIIKWLKQPHREE